MLCLKNIFILNAITNPSSMKHGFFGYLGNNFHFTKYDMWFWILFGILSVFLLYVFKTRIYNWYYKKNNRRSLLISLGITILTIDIFSRIMFSISGYPRHWEIIPLHLCRLSFTILGLFLCFGKEKWIKWVVFSFMIGGILAISHPGLDSNSQHNWYKMIDNKKVCYLPFSQGIDNYFYWDYYITHYTLVISSVFFWIVFKWKYSLKDMIVLTVYSSILLMAIFSLDLIINLINPKEKADYFYQGKYSGIKLPFIFGTIRWPYTFFMWVLLLWTLTFALYLIWVVLGKIDIHQWQWNKVNPNKIILGKWNWKLRN